jgi:hypothetical protein
MIISKFAGKPIHLAALNHANYPLQTLAVCDSVFADQYQALAAGELNGAAQVVRVSLPQAQPDELDVFDCFSLQILVVNGRVEDLARLGHYHVFGGIEIDQLLADFPRRALEKEAVLTLRCLTQSHPDAPADLPDLQIPDQRAYRRGFEIEHLDAPARDLLEATFTCVVEGDRQQAASLICRGLEAGIRRAALIYAVRQGYKRACRLCDLKEYTFPYYLSAHRAAAAAFEVLGRAPVLLSGLAVLSDSGGSSPCYLYSPLHGVYKSLLETLGFQAAHRYPQTLGQALQAEEVRLLWCTTGSRRDLEAIKHALNETRHRPEILCIEGKNLPEREIRALGAYPSLGSALGAYYLRTHFTKDDL